MEENYQDKTLRCKDCGRDFILEASEQKWYAEKEFSEPLRCADCRAERKRQRNNNGYDRR